jgi:hypothetical protein
MKLSRKNRNQKLSVLERDLFLSKVEEILTNLTKEDRKKLDFVKDFIQDCLEINLEGDSKTIIGPMDTKIFEIFLFVILIEYEYQKFIKG